MTGITSNRAGETVIIGGKEYLIVRHVENQAELRRKATRKAKQREETRDWQKRNPDKVEQLRKRYKKRRSEASKLRKKEYQQSEASKLKAKEYRERNSEAIKLAKREWKRNNPEKVRQQKLRYREKCKREFEAAQNAIWEM